MSVPYLDSNVFIHAAIDQGVRGARASDLLRSIAQGERKATTSVLAVDEVVWALRRLVGQLAAVQKGDQVLSYPNLSVLPLTPQHARAALRLMQRYETLRPRDALHVAVALAEGITTIVSDDRDLDRVAEIKREKLG